MTRLHHCLLLVFATPACTVVAETSEPEPDVGVCSVAFSEGVEGVSEGGRTRIALSLEGDVTELTAVGSIGEAYIDGDAVVARPPYGSGGASMNVTLQYTCGGELQSTSVDLGVRAITWSALPTWTPGTDGPLNREYGNMWIDRTNPDRMLAFGGFHYQPAQFTPANELWAYDLTQSTWSQLAPVGAPLRPGAGMALIGDGEAIYYGGMSDNAMPYAVEHFDYAGDTPTFTTLRMEAGALSPPGDYQPSLVWDAPRNRLVAACGLNTTWGQHCLVRAIDPVSGEATALDTVGEAPVGRNGQFWVHDVATERLILFSGDRGDPSCDCHPDTWALELSEEPMRWVHLATQQSVDTLPVGRRNGAFALDPVGHRMFIWGGTPDGASAAAGLYALDLERGVEAWTLVVPAGEAPPDRASGAAIYDGVRARLVMGFGNAAGNYTDLWALAF